MQNLSNNPPRSFRPFIPQVRGIIGANRAATDPVKVHFAWAVRHQVTGRNEKGNVTSVNPENMLGAPQMKFNSMIHYNRWRDNVMVWQEEFDHDLDYDEREEEIPDWMYDMADENPRFK